MPTPVSSLRESAGVRMKLLKTHQPTIGKSLAAALPTPISPLHEITIEN